VRNKLEKKIALFLTTLTLLLIITPLGSPVRQLKVIGATWIYAPAVSETTGGLRGALVNISLIVTEGFGDVYVATSSLTEKDMQAAATTAARIASEILNLNFRNYNFYFKVSSDAIVIGGPSAGVALTVLSFSALSGIPINRSVLVTGMINPDGTVGPVGGVFEKAEIAAKSGIKLFLIPPGQSIVSKVKVIKEQVGPFIIQRVRREPVNLVKYAKENWNLKVKEIESVYEAVKYFTGYLIKLPEYSEPSLSQDMLEALTAQASKLMNEAERNYREVVDEIKRSSIDPFEKQRLLEILDERSLKPLMAAREEPDPYERANLALSSVINSEWIRLIHSYTTHRLELNKIVSKLEKELNETIGLVRKGWKEINDRADIVFLLVATDRAVDAKEKLRQASEIWDKDRSEGLRLLAYVKWRIYTVKLWYEMTKVREGAEIRLEGLKEIAANYLAEARSTWSYAGTLLEEMGSGGVMLDEAFRAYQLAKDSFMENDYVTTCVEAIKSLSYSEASIASAITDITLNSTYIIQYSRRTALMNIARASEAVEPVVSILYLRSGDRSEGIDSRVLFYKLSSYYAKLIRDIASLAKA